MSDTSLEQAEKPDNVTQHKCPNCGAPVLFSPDAEAIVCDYCGTKFNPKELKNLDGDPEAHFDWGEYKKTLSGEKLSGTVTYECQSCGAVIETPKTTMATSCPYCNNNVVLKSASTGGLKPNYIIPFEVSPKKVMAILRKISSEKKFLPFNYFKSCRKGDIQGIYVPYWLFTTKVAGDLVFEGEKVSTSRSSNSITTMTKVYALNRSGFLNFSKLPVDASVKIKNELMDSIEPFDYSKLKPFDSGYLSGFLADRFDSTPDSELPRAQSFIIDESVSHFRTTCKDYSVTKVSSNNLHLVNPKVEYAMFPVYLLNCSYEGQDYHYAINGQTGKFTGEFPISKNKKKFIYARNFFIPAGILYLILLFIQIFF